VPLALTSLPGAPPSLTLPPQGGREQSATVSALMTHPGEQFYPEGVRWDVPLHRGTLPDLLSKAARDFGARPAIEFPTSRSPSPNSNQ